MKRWILAAALGASLLSTPAWAKKGGNAKADKDDDSDDDSDDEGKKPDKKKTEPKKADKKAEPKKADDEEDSDDESDDGEGKGGFKGSTKNVTKETGETPMVKQDLNGHDMGARKRITAFEKDRFFVDKSDTDDTEDKTLVQGSLTSSTFLFHETSGGTYTAPGSGAAVPTVGDLGSSDGRYFTDLRLQTDFRHIGGSRWDARVDGRLRFVAAGHDNDEALTTMPGPTTNVQSGLLGQNEYDLRELWLIRNGERTDVTIGRQYILDLAAVKIDGLRIDYASSPKLTYLGFAGLYPFRGSRSITTDYIDLKDPTDGTPAGQFIGTGGFGAAYRTQTAYGSFGGVTQFPLDKESPRVFGTAQGYWRVNPTLDIYHFALIDLISSYGAQLTNLTGGLNYKPSQALRLSASYNRVDTETLNIQAGAYLDQAQGNSAVQNELFISRLATNQARASLSAGLGNLQRIEVTVAAGYRSRPGFTLNPIATAPMGAQPLALRGARSYEVFGSIIDRRSIADLRLGIDGVQTFASGDISYQRSEVFAVRAFASRELSSGKGEWEAEISYSTTSDKTGGATSCLAADVATCFGLTNGTVISAGGSLYYRINRDWFLIAQAYLSQTTLTVTGQAADPSITGLSGYFRIAYRF